MSLSAKQAAEAVGMTKQGIIKAIREGKISAEKGTNGQWSIQPVELFRVYKPKNQVDDQLEKESSPSFTGGVDASLHMKNMELQLRLEAAHKEIASLQADKEDYKSRLDKEAEERRKLTLMLTDMREKPVETPKGFWARLLGGGNA